jgi:pimeloyl-ACP methyl ester carboxylesterase
VKLDTTIHKGHPEKPVIIFVHGFAVDKDIWINPLDTKVFAKNIPLKYLSARRPAETTARQKKVITTGVIPEKVDGLWSRLKKEGYSLVCWSQRRPVGPIHVAVEELGEVRQLVKGLFPESPIAFIGHSRGGLVARKFMERKNAQIKALITIASPHAGSSLSKIGKYLVPLQGAIKSILPEETHGSVSRTLKRIHDLIDGRALKELVPASDFFRHLKDSPFKAIKYLSFGGEKTELVNIYRWEKRDGKMHPRKLMTVPDSLLKFLPEFAVPDELRPGKGDIMVTTESAVLPWASDHINLKANHFTILWNRQMISKTLEVLKSVSRQANLERWQ